MSGFVDECQLCARGGRGGAGAVSVRREAHVARGGPDGGDGGGGGDVWLVADRNVASLLAFRDHPHRIATDGAHGMGKKRHGHGGDDLEVAVPEGTVVADRDGAVIADLAHAGDRFLAAEGGRGGRGNAKFLSNARRAPAFAEQGEPGQERWLRLELKLAADVALVGFPNVGKSTLISAISAARPKIADYPFTPLEPQLGVVRRDDAEMVVADIPGLIEGAAEGKGLGHRFLRHVERARVLCILVDLAAAEGTPTPAEQLDALLVELEAFRPELLERPRLVVGSRADVARFEPGDGSTPALDAVVSAVTRDGVDRLVSVLLSMVAEARHDQAGDRMPIVHRPPAEGVRVQRAPDGSWEVIGREAARAVALSDLTDPGAQAHAWAQLRRLGVARALTRAGVRSGDEVSVGALSFTWEEDGAELDDTGPRRPS
jgi:GTP-binding protein